MQTSIAEASSIKGFIGACLVDSDSGLMLASVGGGKLDLDLVAALNTEFVKAQQNAVDEFGLGEKIQDILVTLDRQVHLIRPLDSNRSVFVYLALDKDSSNLGMARLQLKKIEASLQL